MESLRGLAAIYVLIHHAKWLLSESYSLRKSSVIDFNYVLTKLFVPFRFGHEAVIFFFILSGFVIHYSSSKGLGTQNLNILSYLKKRVNRIFPPLILALLITLVFDFFGKNVLRLGAYSFGSKYYSLIVDNLNLEAFLGNVFLLQELNAGVKHLGSNAALWSLSYEWWFYLIYPIFFTINRKNKLVAFCIQILLYLIVSFLIPIAIPIVNPIFTKMLIWWFGVVIADLYLSKSKILPYLSVFLIGIPIAIVFFDRHKLVGDIFWGLGFLGLMATLLSLNPRNPFILFLNKIKSIGSYSYTLYLIHVPVIFMAYAILLEVNKGKLPETYLYVFLMTIICIVISKFLSSKIEKVIFFKL